VQLGVNLGAFGALGAIGGGLPTNNLGGVGALGGFGGGGVIGNPWLTAAASIPGGMFNRYQIPSTSMTLSSRLSWEELAERRREMLEQRQQARENARRVGSAVAAMGESLESLAVDADRIGEGFQYTLDQKVTLSRQKSALLPVLDNAIGLERFSIYNKEVHPRFPLHGVKVKNTTGQHLLQGPVAVFEGASYAGDTRLSDLQPDQERLLSYAMDLGLEVRDEPLPALEERIRVSVVNGVIRTELRQQSGTKYTLYNRSKRDRSLLVEYPITEGWKLTDTDKPIEKARKLYRFAWKVPANKILKRSVKEETIKRTSLSLDKTTAAHLRVIAGYREASKAVKDLLEGVIERREKLEAIGTQVAQISEQKAAIESEQARLRTNLDKLPRGSAAHKRILDKFDHLEIQLEKFQAQQREKQTETSKLQKEYQAFIKDLNAK
jgi:hypothetical protein